jgi:hypothetical protein
MRVPDVVLRIWILKQFDSSARDYHFVWWLLSIAAQACRIVDKITKYIAFI